jgi:uncharacterized membrane protein YphA (DoxX/SURF4 family)
MKSLGLLLLRVVAGGSLAAHGYTKLFGGEGKTPHPALTRIYGQNFPKAVEGGSTQKFAQGLEQMGVPYPQVAAYASGAAEFGGGLALLTGTMTRLAALVVLFNMLVAIRKAHWSTGLFGQGGYELPAQFAAAAGTLLLTGPGAISVDGIFSGIRNTGRAVSSAGSSAASAGRSAAGAGRSVVSRLPMAGD